MAGNGNGRRPLVLFAGLSLLEWAGHSKCGMGGGMGGYGGPGEEWERLWARYGNCRIWEVKKKK